MDSTVNEVDGVNVSGYPTLIYYGKDDKEGKKYEGERNLEALVKFVEESAGLRPKEEESDKPVDGEKADL
jgi:protein disulfide-isomerase A1